MPEYIKLSDVVKYVKLAVLYLSVIGIIVLAIWILFSDLKGAYVEVKPLLRGVLLIWLTQLFFAIKNKF